MRQEQFAPAVLPPAAPPLPGAGPAVPAQQPYYTSPPGSPQGSPMMYPSPPGSPMAMSPAASPVMNPHAGYQPETIPVPTTVTPPAHIASKAKYGGGFFGFGPVQMFSSRGKVRQRTLVVLRHFIMIIDGDRIARASFMHDITEIICSGQNMNTVCIKSRSPEPAMVLKLSPNCKPGNAREMVLNIKRVAKYHTNNDIRISFMQRGESPMKFKPLLVKSGGYLTPMKKLELLKRNRNIIPRPPPRTAPAPPPPVIQQPVVQQFVHEAPRTVRLEEAPMIEECESTDSGSARMEDLDKLKYDEAEVQPVYQPRVVANPPKPPPPPLQRHDSKRSSKRRSKDQFWSQFVREYDELDHHWKGMERDSVLSPNSSSTHLPSPRQSPRLTHTDLHELERNHSGYNFSIPRRSSATIRASPKAMSSVPPLTSTNSMGSIYGPDSRDRVVQSYI